MARYTGVFGHERLSHSVRWHRHRLVTWSAWIKNLSNLNDWKDCIWRTFGKVLAFALTMALVGVILTSIAAAQNPLTVSKPEPDNSVEVEQKSFTVSQGFEVNLFADETDGVANPICMSWDPAGRLWVLCTWAYPQLNLTEQPNDKLLILADNNGDGRADQTTVFADGLNMPTGFALGSSGAYIGHGTDLLHLQDTDGDDQVDTRRVLLTGFGTGDTHQNINSFTWSPGGELFFCQGLHAFSRVETPWGISRLREHGTWRLRPRRLQLNGFRRTSGANPWGIAFGNWGEPFIKSNDGEISELLPAMVSNERSNRKHGQKIPQTEMKIGATQMKSMILEFAESPHLPNEMQGELLIAGYKSREVNRFQWQPNRSGHRLTDRPPLIRSSHNAFRPVDIRIGPDGAIYIADWFNPIIAHYQASFRHPDRDKTHGRIWRVTATGHPLAKAPALATMNAPELCQQLTSEWRYVRYQAKRRLADLPKEKVIPALATWVANLAPSDPDLERHWYEAIGVFESHEVVNQPLLQHLLTAQDYRARAYATRIVGRWHDRLEKPLELLSQSVIDESSRVRLEAIVACSDIHVPTSIVVAANAFHQPSDRFINYAFKQTVHSLAPYWQPALQQGKLDFASPSIRIHVLATYGGKDIARQVRGLIQSKEISDTGRRQLLELLARVGTADDLQTVFGYAVQDSRILQSLPSIAELRRIKPSGEVHNRLSALLAGDNMDGRISAARLAGLWQQKKLIPSLQSIIGSEHNNDHFRAAVIQSLVELAPETALEQCQPFIKKKFGSTVYLAALQALSQPDVQAAAIAALKLLTELQSADAFGPVLNIVLRQGGGADALVHALQEVRILPNHVKLISRWLSASGRDDEALVRTLKSQLGIHTGRPIPYSPTVVRELAAEVRDLGNPITGKRLFISSLANCAGCHRVQGLNQKLGAFPKGPDLTAVGSGLHLELIIESVLWPNRQIKEGYEMTTLITDDGRTFSGYLTSDNGSSVGIRDLATGNITEIAREAIEEQVSQGTAMPAGFTNTLTRTELCDLIAYLNSL